MKTRLGAILRRHLEAVDPETCGRGTEPEQGPEVRDDPMAWSLYLRGFARLAAAYGNPAYRNAARACLEKLLLLRSPTPTGESAWGLPYAWKGRERHHPYAITTAMCGDALIDALDAGLEAPRDAIASAGTWLAHTLPWHETAPGIACPAFSPLNSFLAPNVASRTAGVLYALCAAGLGGRRLRARARAALAYTLEACKPPGFWHYGRSSEAPEGKPKVDNIHTAYVLEGLARSVEKCRRLFPPPIVRRAREAFARGLAFYRDRLYRDEGAYERVFVIEGERRRRWRKRYPHWREDPLDEGRSVFFDPQPTRSWGLGAALVVASLAERSAVLEERSFGAALLERIEAREVAPGRFGYRPGHPEIYVRHEAHIFFGLVTAALAVQLPDPLG